MDGYYSGTEDQCPICKTSTYLNSSLKMLISVCHHKYCEPCIRQHFVKQDTLICSMCQTPLKRQSFTAELAGDGDKILDKETRIRKRILRDFNKRQEHFPTLLEYNNYLEVVEDLIYDLSHDVNVDKHTAFIEDYKRKNAAQISQSQAKQAEEERIMREQREARERKALTGNDGGDDDTEKGTGKKSSSVKKDGAAADMPALNSILNAANGSAAPKGPSYQPAAPVAAASAQPQPMQMPKRDPDSLADDKQHQENAMRAGGYSDALPKKRALEEFFSSLLITPKKPAS